jgi:nicotinate phosphoribosyltransferase
VIARFREDLDGRPLLRLVLQAGKRTSEGADDLQSARHRAAQEIDRLPRHVTAIDPADPPYPVTVSEALQQHHADVRDNVLAI